MKGSIDMIAMRGSGTVVSHDSMLKMALSWIFFFNSSKRGRQQTWHNAHQGLTADRMRCCSPSLHVFGFVLLQQLRPLCLHISCQIKEKSIWERTKVPPHTQIAHWWEGCGVQRGSTLWELWVWNWTLNGLHLQQGKLEKWMYSPKKSKTRAFFNRVQ